MMKEPARTKSTSLANRSVPSTGLASSCVLSTGLASSCVPSTGLASSNAMGNGLANSSVPSTGLASSSATSNGAPSAGLTGAGQNNAGLTSSGRNNAGLTSVGRNNAGLTRKTRTGLLGLLLVFLLALTACGADSSRINVVSREDGSGTRGAFVELTGILEKGEGVQIDHTVKNALIAGKTGIMLATVAGDRGAIGYLSMGSVNDTVKAIALDGVAATAENVRNGSYKLARPFNIATSGEPSVLAADFIAFILSAEGQAIVADSYIPVGENAAAYAGTRPAGKLVVVGSSSVAPVMEKLIEGYRALNADAGAVIELQVNDSTAGMNAVREGIADIGMASRELKASELESLTPTAIAIDGLAVIVHPENPLANITAEQLRSVFVGAITSWDELSPAM